MIDKKTYLSTIVMMAVFTGGTILSINAESNEEEMLVHTISGSMVDIPLEAFGEFATYVIVGEVIELNPVVYTNPDLAEKKRLMISTGEGGIIYDREILTDVTIRVEEDLFGKYTESTITVRVPGGEIPGYKTIHKLAPTFTIGERVSIFVGYGQSYSISSDNYVVLGLYQGTIKMNDIGNSKFANSTTTEQQIKDKIKALKVAEM